MQSRRKGAKHVASLDLADTASVTTPSASRGTPRGRHSQTSMDVNPLLTARPPGDMGGGLEATELLGMKAPPTPAAWAAIRSSIATTLAQQAQLAEEVLRLQGELAQATTSTGSTTPRPGAYRVVGSAPSLARSPLAANSGYPPSSSNQLLRRSSIRNTLNISRRIGELQQLSANGPVSGSPQLPLQHTVLATPRSSMSDRIAFTPTAASHT